MADIMAGSGLANAGVRLSPRRMTVVIGALLSGAAFVPTL